MVYKAEQKEPKRLVALKVIKVSRRLEREEQRRFDTEKRALALLKHPGVAQIHEAGVTRDGWPYLVMELVEGETLGEFLERRDERQAGAGNLELRLRLFQKVCEAVGHAHRLGILHRDLKPSNIMVVDRGGKEPEELPEVKVLDFGLARIVETEGGIEETLTRSGAILGTLPYMSPEQARGEPVTTLSDVYSLGVVLYEVVSGRRPYEVRRRGVLEVLQAICEERPPAPSQVQGEAEAHGRRRGIGRDLDVIVLKALEKEPSRRYGSVGELAGESAAFPGAGLQGGV